MIFNLLKDKVNSVAFTPFLVLNFPRLCKIDCLEPFFLDGGLFTILCIFALIATDDEIILACKGSKIWVSLGSKVATYVSLPPIILVT